MNFRSRPPAASSPDRRELCALWCHASLRALRCASARLCTALLLALGGCHKPGETGAAAYPPRMAAVTAPSFAFEDVTTQAGLDYKWQIEGKRPLTILQTIGNGCAFLDYDNDGNLDILLVGPRLALYKGDGHGHFTDVTHQTGLDRLHGNFLGCAVGDYDNDGYDDLYISGYRTGRLLHNEKGQGFRDVTALAGLHAQPWGTAASFVDVDGDGKLDLMVGNYVAFDADTNPQLCRFGSVLSACGPHYYNPEYAALYHNEGGGRFRDVSGASGARNVSGKTLGLACADYDGSGRQSIAVANDEMPGDLLQNTPQGLKNVGASAGVALDNDGRAHGGMGLDWGDYDGDGRLDLAVATFEHEPKNIYHNDDGSTFSDRSVTLGVAEKLMMYVSFGVKFVDADNDGWLDLIFTNGHVEDNIGAIEQAGMYRNPCVFLHNLGGRHFEQITVGDAKVSRPIVGRGLAVGDFDNDGRMDALVVDSEGTPLLLHNVTQNKCHWLSVRLIGSKSNRDGLGALVTVQSEGRSLLRRCATDGSYLSASDRRVHFGLGQAARPVRITVRWPSGQTDVVDDVAPDRAVTLREGAKSFVPER